MAAYTKERLQQEWDYMSTEEQGHYIMKLGEYKTAHLVEHGNLSAAAYALNEVFALRIARGLESVDALVPKPVTQWSLFNG